MPSLLAAASLGVVLALLGYSVLEEDQGTRGAFERLPPEAFGEAPGREDVYFPCGSGGALRCHAWLFLPQKVYAPPVVVMGHGFGGQKDFGLEKFARRFAEAGIAAFVFDYRYWGGSEGEPRHLLEVSRQHQDWFSALDYVQDSLNADLGGGEPDGRDIVDPSRVGIWGSSFAGGHVIAVAGSYKRKHAIKAVVSQIPYSDGLVTLPAMLTTMGLPWALRLSVHSLKDMIRRALGMSRHYMPIIDEGLKAGGDAATAAATATSTSLTAVIATPECSNYWRLIKEETSARLGGWRNRLPASIALEFPFYRPVTYAVGVEAPTLGVYAEKDSLCPVEGVKQMFAKVRGPTETKGLPGGHFGAYLEDFEKVVQWETDFLVKHLLSAK